MMKSLFILIALMATGCDCGFGGAGCDDPWMVGLCEETLVTGQEYIILWGHSSDTGLSEATVRSVESMTPEVLEAHILAPGVTDVPDGGFAGPFDLNNGPGDGGVLLRPLSAGRASVSILLDGWDKPTVLEIDVIDPTESFVEMSAAERLDACIESSRQVSP